jgi:hypothetical protein
LIAKKPFDMGVKAHFNDYGVTPGFPHIERSFVWLRKTKSNAQNAKAIPGNLEPTHYVKSKDTDAKIFKNAAISLHLKGQNGPKSIPHSNVRSAAQT